MPTDTHIAGDQRIARAAIQLNLTAAGWAVVAMMAAAVFLSASSRLAVGFLIPLAAGLAIDMYLSWHVVSRRSISIVPSRTVVHSPDGVPLRVTATGPPHPLQVSITTHSGGDAVFGISDDYEIVELTVAHTSAVDFVRCSVYGTVFGLSSARRWETHTVPTLHWAPAPNATRVTTPSAVDEVARLRAYVPGDRMSRVSWPVTARTGQMHVRAAGDGHEEFTIAVNLGTPDGSPGEAAVVVEPVPMPMTAPNLEVLEATLQLASTLISQLLEDGHQVRLLTTEVTPDVRDDMRRAAISNPRLAPEIADTNAVQLHVVDQYVTDDDDAARRLALADIGPNITWSYGPYVDVSMLGVRTQS